MDIRSKRSGKPLFIAAGEGGLAIVLAYQLLSGIFCVAFYPVTSSVLKILKKTSSFCITHGVFLSAHKWWDTFREGARSLFISAALCSSIYVI